MEMTSAGVPKVHPGAMHPAPIDMMKNGRGSSARWTSGLRPVDVRFDHCGRMVVSDDGPGGYIVMITAATATDDDPETTTTTQTTGTGTGTGSGSGTGGAGTSSPSAVVQAGGPDALRPITPPTSGSSSSPPSSSFSSSSHKTLVVVVSVLCVLGVGVFRHDEH